MRARRQETGESAVGRTSNRDLSRLVRPSLIEQLSYSVHVSSPSFCCPPPDQQWDPMSHSPCSPARIPAWGALSSEILRPGPWARGHNSSGARFRHRRDVSDGRRCRASLTLRLLARLPQPHRARFRPGQREGWRGGGHRLRLGGLAFPGARWPGLSMLLVYAHGRRPRRGGGASLPTRREGDLEIVWHVKPVKGVLHHPRLGAAASLSRQELLPIACWTALSSTSSSNGFRTKSTAPPFLARIVMGTSTVAGDEDDRDGVALGD
jgi:hypothetical protein